MIKIMIIDDDYSDMNVLSGFIDEYFKGKNIEYNIRVSNHLNFDVCSLSDIDVLYLDMKVNNKSGLDFAKELRKKNKDMIIVITSNFSQFLIDGYTIDAKRYFIKPIDCRIFNLEMDSILKNLSSKKRGFYEYTISSDIIYCKNIFYIEYYDRMSIIHLKNGSIIKTYLTLKYWIEKLEGLDFEQPYRSFLVNLEYVNGFSKDGKDILISNGEKIPVSKLYKKKFKENYYRYMLGTV